MRPRSYSDDLIFQSISIVLMNQGYDDLTLQRVAYEAGLSPAILSKRFGSKSGMLLAYYGHVVDATQQYFLQLARQSIPPVDKLKKAFLQSHGPVIEPKAFANIAMLYLKLDLEPAFTGKSKERLDLIDDEVQKLLREAMDRGDIRQGNAAALSRVLQGAVTGAYMLWCKADRGGSLTERIDECFEHILGA
jgi:AcrR family transcriptional regulator